MIFVDSHVHIYGNFNIDRFFNAAVKNFQHAADQIETGSKSIVKVLLLTEGKTYTWFNTTYNRAASGKEKVLANQWRVNLTGESNSLRISKDSDDNIYMYVIAGQQIVTGENIEVLALVCNQSIPDGLPLERTVDIVRNNNAIPVIPWGVGKWLGKRGAILRDYYANNLDEVIFLGDNGGRPRFWKSPQLFNLSRSQGKPILPGSDPLPLVEEAERVGSFGFYMDHDEQIHRWPAKYLKQLLESGSSAIQPYGKLQSSATFFKNQIMLRISR